MKRLGLTFLILTNNYLLVGCLESETTTTNALDCIIYFHPDSITSALESTDLNNGDFEARMLEFWSFSDFSAEEKSLGFESLLWQLILHAGRTVSSMYPRIR